MKSPLTIFPGTMRPPAHIQDPVEVLKHPKEAKKHFITYVREEVLVLNFYRTHMLYFIIVILVSSVIVYGEGLANGSTEFDGRLRYIDCLFLCCSAMTTTGLNTVNLGNITAFQQAVLAVLLFIGNVTFVSTFVVLIRRHFFRSKLKEMVTHSRAARQAVEDIEKQESNKSQAKKGGEMTWKGNTTAHNSDNQRDQHLRKRRACKEEDEAPMIKKSANVHHQSGLGTFPAPWEIGIVRRFVSYPFRKLARDRRQKKQHPYVSFDVKFDNRGRFHALDEMERRELGGVEYRARGTLLYILCAYQILWLALGTVFLVPYVYRREVVEILHSAQPGNLKPGWFGFFVVITGFCNGGLNLLNANFIPLYKNYFILIVEAVLTVAGNTQFPIFLRLLIWTLSKTTSQNSSLGQSLAFLLHHPRRCFIYLFPSKETWYLLTIQISIDLTMWVLFEILNIGMPAVDAMPTNVRVFDGLFQATGLRTSGAYIITMTSLAPALLIAYLIAMYISSFPIVMALRQTNTYEERSIGLDKGNSSGGLGLHLKRQLAYDIWFQMFAWFLICIVERHKLVINQDGFSMFSILFEVTSAYGTVGLSTGVSYDNYSLSGAFQTLSKVIMLAVILRGRHKGLPLAIDRSILIPGEDLMHKMDQEYNGYGDQKSSNKERISAQGTEAGEGILEDINNREGDKGSAESEE
ncbi:TrkH-domain-containing protein [Tothia fuscella]|uniref:TrkH-domain-containing protein n=1 Tax=Tothia fuscella TaxID=1048955 RepID=A0A9P4NJV2_9PEZI|nr:TrkH-domain-containing protein [Tothia fuscella]